jgi:hypothetical protein
MSVPQNPDSIASPSDIPAGYRAETPFSPEIDPAFVTS